MSSYLTGIAHSSRALATTSKINYLAVATASGLVSLWLVLLDPVLGSAAVTRLQEARMMLASNGGAGDMPLSLWPFAVASLHQLSGLSLLTSAHLLTSLLYVFVCLAFVSTVRTLGGSWCAQLMAAVLAIVHPLLCDFRSDLVVAPGYWAFSLLALRQLVLYCHDPDWSNRLTWFVWISAATLFKLDALVLANVAPLVLLLALPRRQRLTAGFKLLIPAWIATSALMLSGGLAAIAAFQDSPLPADFPAWRELAGPAGLLPAGLADLVPQLAQNPDRSWAVAGGLLGLLTATVGRAFTAVCLLLLLAGWWRGSLAGITRPARYLLNAHISVNLLLLAGYAVLGNEVTREDTALGVLLLLLYLPFIVEDWWRRGPRYWRLLALASLLVLGSGGLYNRKFEQQYLADASDWLRDNTPVAASVLSNSPFIMYSSGSGIDTPLLQPSDPAEFLAGDAWRSHQLLALQLAGVADGEWYPLVLYPQLEVLKVFSGPGREMLLVLENTAISPPGHPGEPGTGQR